MESMNEARDKAQRQYQRERKRERLDNLRRDAMAIAIDSLRSDNGHYDHRMLTQRAEAIFNFLKGDSA